MVTPLRGYTYHSVTITLMNAQHQRVIGEADSREATIFKIFKIRVRKNQCRKKLYPCEKKTSEKKYKEDTCQYKT